MESLNGKSTGDTLTASEWNQVPSELQNVIESQGITLSNSDLAQVVKAISQYSVDGQFFTVGGVVNAYTLTAVGLKAAPVTYTEGMRFSGNFTVPNTGGPCTLNLNGLGVINVKGQGGEDPEADEVSGITEFVYDGANAVVQLKSAGLSKYDGFRNKIIGGDFATNPFQRGSSFAPATSSTYIADRFRIDYATSATLNTSKVNINIAPELRGAFSDSMLQVSVGTADVTLAPGDYCSVSTRIEGLDIAMMGFGQSGTRYVTLALVHRHVKTGTYCIGFQNGVPDRSYVAEYTQSVSNATEVTIITVPVDTSGTWAYDNTIGLNVVFTIAAGTTYQTTAGSWQNGNFFATSNQVNGLDNAANNFRIGLVQLEPGQTATNFEALSTQQVRALCRRYCYELVFSNGIGLNGFSDLTTEGRFYTLFENEMRANPTFSNPSGVPGNFAVRRDSGAASTATGLAAAVNTQGAVISVTCAGLTLGEGVSLVNTAGTPSLRFDAEL